MPTAGNTRAATPGSIAGWLVATAVGVALLLPSLVWILRDTSAWGGDQSQYGFATLDLYQTLRVSPTAWLSRLLDVFPWKPNGLIWLGQAFVPLATILRSMDAALLLTTIAVQAAAVVLVYRALTVASNGRLIVPFAACLAMASAPLFVAFAHYYLVESFQVMSVAWFILIVCLAPRWTRALLFAQLFAATVVALAAKQTQPLFCIWPGIVACIDLLRPRRPEPSTDRPMALATIATWAFAIPVGAATAAWYWRNQAAVLAHLREGTYGQGVKTLWGKEDTYFNTIAWWLNAARQSLFMPWIAEGVLLLVAAGALVWMLSNRRVPSRLSVCTLVAALQLVTVVAVFSLSPTRQSRYFLPALPYAAVVIAWALTQIDRKLVTAAALIAFATQFTMIHGQALALLPPRSPFIKPVEPDARSGRVMEGIVARTCSPTAAAPLWNILAVDPSVPQLGGDWLAPDPANYVVAKQHMGKSVLPCHYGYIGDGFFGSPDIGNVWALMESHRTEYVIVLDPAVYPIPERVFNQSLSREHFPELLQRLQASADFALEPRLAEDPGVMIFRRGDRIAKGRSLSDLGRHDEAIAMLRATTEDVPKNAEAWANLSLALERAKQFNEAIAAGLRARELNPAHYYVSMILARSSSEVGRWPDAARYARDAIGQAHGEGHRTAALSLAAQASFAAGDDRRGCELLQAAGARADVRGFEAAAAACGWRR